MHVKLDYGKTGLSVELPDANVRQILSMKPSDALQDIKDAINNALRSPIGSRSLIELAANRVSACIVICDITRPVPNQQLLPPILKTLNSAGLHNDQIVILVATGTHRPNLGNELIQLVGSEIASTIRIINHDCHDRCAQIWMGMSPNGVPVWLDRTYVEADFKITVGLIEPHFMAGYSGGRKLIMPGIADFETIQNWHCPKFLESPYASNGIIEKNPVHAESLAIAKMARPDMIVDVTLNEANEITGVFAGNLEEAWLCGTQYAAKHVRAGTAEKADIVVTSCAGYPLDTTFYQAVKGMVGALPVVKQGGTIVIAAECSEGIGSADFTKALLEISDIEDFVRQISQPKVFIPEEWEIEELAKAIRQAEIICVASGISHEKLSRCFVTPAASVEEGVECALQKHGRDSTILVIPRGPYVIPYVGANNN